MIKLGDLNFTSIKQGSTDIVAVYLADEMIWGGSQPSTDFNVRLTLNGGTISSVTFSDGIIPNSAFTDNLDIVGVEIGSSITRVNSNAFAKCSNISSVTIGNSVTRLGGYAFSGCTALTEVVIPDSVTEFGGGVFNYCSGLTDVTIGSGFTTFSNPYAFQGCRSLTSITINATTAPTLTSGTFIQVPSVGTLYVPYGSDYSSWIGTGATSSNQLASGWTIEYINAPSVGGDVILHLTGGTLSSITYSDGIIPQRAFRQNSAITMVEIESGITQIGQSAFAYCSGITDVEIGENVTSIGGDAFYYCTALSSVSIPNSVTTIGDEAFMSCNSLSSLTIGNGVTSIGDYALQSYHLSSITCNAVTAPSLGTSVFATLPSVGTLYVPYGSDYSSWIGTSATSGDKLASGWTISYIGVVVYEDWTSTNKYEYGGAQSTSSHQWGIVAESGDTLTFDYEVSSEKDYDFLYITIDGVEVIRVSGEESGTYTKNITSDGTITVIAYYEIDISGYEGLDQGRVYNMVLHKGR